MAPKDSCVAALLAFLITCVTSLNLFTLMYEIDTDTKKFNLAV